MPYFDTERSLANRAKRGRLGVGPTVFGGWRDWSFAGSYEMRWVVVPSFEQPLPSRHRTERGSAGSTSQIINVDRVDPALPRSVLCLLGISHYSVGRAFDSQFFHPMSQGVRMHAKSSGGSVRTLNHTVCLL